MEYLRLMQDRRHLHTPYIHTLRDVVRKEEDLYIHDGASIPDQSTVFVYTDQPSEFVSILDEQIYLVSESVKKVFSMYAPLLRYKQFFLFNNRRGEHHIYHAPIFRQLHCIAPESRWNPFGNRVTHCVLDKERIGNEPIFKVAGAGERIVVIRLDVAESLLRREIIDLRLEEMEVR